MKFTVDSAVLVIRNSLFAGDESQEYAGQIGTVVRVKPTVRQVQLLCGPKIWCDTRELQEVQAGPISKVAEAAAHYAAALDMADVARVECARREAELEAAAQSLLGAATAKA